jgi:hypothetical protein
MKGFLLLGIFLISTVGHSAGKKYSAGRYGSPGFDSFCVCQYGNSTEFEMFMFRRGCSVWFVQNDCGATSVISLDDPVIDSLPEKFSGKIRVGYVGHWNSSEQFIEFLQSQILPITEQRNFTALLIDNTGCNAMADADSVKAYVNTALQSTGKKVEIRGNETVSIGLWDSFYLGKGNLTATISADGGLHFPVCEDYIGSACPFRARNGHKLEGFCQAKDGVKKWLGCETKTIRKNLGRAGIQITKIDVWTEIER